MTVKLPESIKVGAHNIKVSFPHKFLERSDLVGQNDNLSKVIRIADSDGGTQPLADTVIKQAFLHELLHAADNTSGHCLFNDNEKALEGISECLCQVLQDNPDVLAVFKSGTGYEVRRKDEPTKTSHEALIAELRERGYVVFPNSDAGAMSCAEHEIESLTKRLEAHGRDVIMARDDEDYEERVRDAFAVVNPMTRKMEPLQDRASERFELDGMTVTMARSLFSAYLATHGDYDRNAGITQ